MEKYFGGYARDKTGRNYCLNAKNSLLKKIRRCQNVFFSQASYEKLNPHNYLIYCDPPYAGTTGYDAVAPFDHDKFWNVMRKWSEHNLVFISEYKAPNDFKCVWSADVKTDLYKKERTEKIYHRI